MLKDLILGKLSLAKTFWFFGFGVTIIMSSLEAELRASPYTRPIFIFLFLVIIIRILLSWMTFSGITFILRNDRISFWGIIAWAILLAQSFILTVDGILIVAGLIIVMMR
ncbi:hypothetical protein [Aeromonas jandaei]|uniref:hypothetical protein n=1 Tax=Aeromonas jandaei TaxID=650 RepID=UPI003B9DD9B2